MLYAGIDVHKKNLQVCVVGSDDNRLSNCRPANEPESVAGYFAAIKTRAAVGLEADQGIQRNLVRLGGCRTIEGLGNSGVSFP